MTLQDKVALTSSVLLRGLAYIFLRWIPGHVSLPWRIADAQSNSKQPFPPLIYALFAVYIPSFISSFLTQPQFHLVADDVDIVVTERIVEDEPKLRNQRAPKRLPVEAPLEIRPAHIEEDVEIEETIVVEERPAKPWRTLLTGLPSPTSALLSLLTLLINVGLILAVTDLVYRGRYEYPAEDLSFARIGHVSDSHAKLLIREPNHTQWPVRVQMKILNPEPPFDLTGWQDQGGVNFFTNQTDYTAIVTMALREGKSTDYEWRTSNNHSGSFRGGPQPGHKFFEKRDTKLSFLTSSCIIPKFPYNPFDHPLTIPGFKYLGNLLPSLAPHFMLFLGDFIYIDVPKRFGSTIEDYRREYRQVYASPDWPLVSNLSWIHVLDDHEIANDYDNGPNTKIFQTALDPFQHYQVAANPPPSRKAGTLGEIRHGATWFEFDSGPAEFFMMDTRKHRSKNNELPVDSTAKSMLGKDQLADLLAFLDRPLPEGIRWKIVASSVPFTQNWGGPSSKDTWAGFLEERQVILEHMWEAGAKGAGVVVLSGDRHEFAATAFPPPAGKWPISATVNEFSTSPLSQFYLPIPTYKETGDDIMVKYIPHGNSSKSQLCPAAHLAYSR